LHLAPGASRRIHLAYRLRPHLGAKQHGCQAKKGYTRMSGLNPLERED
jgi:hypothetical protein